MSVLITKAKSRSSASRKLRPANKSKKASSKKPQRPGRITAAPKSKKTLAAKKKVVPAKKALVSKKAKVQTHKKGQPKPRSAKAKALQSSRKPVPKAIASRKATARPRLAPPVKLAPPPPKKPPAPGTLAAVRAFEQALRFFNRHDYGQAKSAFEGLQTKFGDEAEVLARTRTYLAVCDQRLGRSPAAPRNADALYDQGVFDFNRGALREAVELFEKALRIEPRADHVFYSLAAAYARLNDSSKALEALRRAIAIRPVQRSHARRDLDFASLRSNDDFQSLTGFGFDLVEE